MAVVSARPERLRALAESAATAFEDLTGAAGTLGEKLEAYVAGHGPEWRAEVEGLEGAVSAWAADMAALGAWTGAVADALEAADAEGAAGIHRAPEARLRALLPCTLQPVLDGTGSIDDLDPRDLPDLRPSGPHTGRTVDIATAPSEQGPELLINVPSPGGPEALITVPSPGGAEALINLPAPGGPEALINVPPPPWLDALSTREHADEDTDELPEEEEEGEEPPPLRSPEDVFDNPDVLQGRTPEEVEDAIGSAPGWEVERMRRGNHQGQGWILREYTPDGRMKDRMIQWHPGGGHHGDDPYWKISSGKTRRVWIIPS